MRIKPFALDILVTIRKYFDADHQKLESIVVYFGVDVFVIEIILESYFILLSSIRVCD